MAYNEHIVVYNEHLLVHKTHSLIHNEHPVVYSEHPVVYSEHPVVYFCNGRFIIGRGLKWCSNWTQNQPFSDDHSKIITLFYSSY